MPQKTAEIDAVAQVYAQSLFDLADQDDSTTSVETAYEELNAVINLMDENATFAEFMQSVLIPVKNKRDSIKKIFSESISDLTLRFLLVLNDKERLGHISAIAAAYRELYWIKIGRMEVVAYTPKPMNEDESKHIIELIKNATGKDPVMTNAVEPAMIGGLKLRIGDKFIDASITTRLNQMREQFAKSGAETVRNRLDAMIE